MNNTPIEHPDTLRSKVLAAISGGQVHMRPRSYFILQVAALVGLLVLALGISVFLVNFIFFMVRVGGHASLLGFGSRGLGVFLMIFPWVWLILDVLLLTLAAQLFRKFRIGYRHSALYVVGAFVLFVVLAGLALESGTPLNDRLLERADQDQLPPPLGGFYEGVHVPALHERGVFRGVVSTIGTSTLSITHDDFDRDHDDGGFTVRVPEGFPISSLSVGDHVYVAGTPTPDGIEAYGIQKLPPTR